MSRNVLVTKTGRERQIATVPSPVPEAGELLRRTRLRPARLGRFWLSRRGATPEQGRDDERGKRNACVASTQPGEHGLAPLSLLVLRRTDRPYRLDAVNATLRRVSRQLAFNENALICSLIQPVVARLAIQRRDTAAPDKRPARQSMSAPFSLNGTIAQR